VHETRLLIWNIGTREMESRAGLTDPSDKPGVSLSLSSKASINSCMSPDPLFMRQSSKTSMKSHTLIPCGLSNIEEREREIVK
jgi:hypothetical protein